MTGNYLTVADLAERYRTSEDTIRYWRHKGIGPVGVRLGKKVLYDPSDVEAWERDQREAQGVAA